MIKLIEKAGRNTMNDLPVKGGDFVFVISRNLLVTLLALLPFMIAFLVFVYKLIF